MRDRIIRALLGRDFQRENYAGANLTGAHFIGDNLTDAIFRHSTVTGANFTASILTRADFRGARGLTPKQRADFKARGAIVDD